MTKNGSQMFFAVVIGIISTTPMYSASVTLSGSKSAVTQTQSGWYHVSTNSVSSGKSEGYISNIHSEDWGSGQPSPDMGSGYVWTDVPVALGSLNLPAGSTVTVARIDYSWGPWPALNDHSPYVQKAAWRVSGNNSSGWNWTPTGETDEPYIATDFQPASQYFINWLMIDGVPRWFRCCPPPNAPSGSIDLIAQGFGQYIKPNSSFVLGGNMQVGFRPGRVYVHTTGWHSHHLHYSISVSLPNSLSATLTIQYTAPPCISPTITSQPKNTTVLSGRPATLSVSAGGCSPLTYQWLAGGSNPITGANADTYITPPLTADTVYSVRVSNGAGSVTSSTAYVTVQPLPTLSALKLSTDATCGSNPASGTVVLTAPAPPGGIPISLASNLPGTASVQTILMVAEGNTSTDFAITTYPVATTVPVTITATYQNVSKTGTLQVGQNFASFTVSPSTVCGGRSPRATVTLFCPAPSTANGVSIPIFAADPVIVKVSDHVVVAPGSTTADLLINTSAVTQDTDVRLTASLGGIQKTANLTITGPIFDATAQTKVTSSGFRYDRASGLFKQSVLVQNQGPSLAGPLTFVLDGLPPNVTLSNEAGVTSCPDPAGSPLVQLSSGVDKNLAPAAVATLLLEFVNPGNVPITYKARILARQQ